MFNIKNLLPVGQTLKAFAAELREVRINIETAKRRREEIVYAPAPMSDVSDALDAWVTRLEEKYASGLLQTVGFLHMNPASIGDPHEVEGRMRQRGLVARGPGGQVHATDVDLVLVGLFGDQLREALRKKVLAMPTLKDTGLPVAKRAQAIAVLDAEMEQLQDAEARLVDSARASGLAVE